MFLLHGCLGRVDGLADAAQLCGEQRTGVNQGGGRSGPLLHPLPTHTTTANTQATE